MAALFPDLSVQQLKEHPGFRMPTPPQIRRHFSQPAQALGKIRDDTLFDFHGRYLSSVFCLLVLFPLHGHATSQKYSNAISRFKATAGPYEKTRPWCLHTGAVGQAPDRVTGG